MGRMSKLLCTASEFINSHGKELTTLHAQPLFQRHKINHQDMKSSHVYSLTKTCAIRLQESSCPMWANQT